MVTFLQNVGKFKLEVPQNYVHKIQYFQKKRKFQSRNIHSPGQISLKCRLTSFRGGENRLFSPPLKFSRQSKICKHHQWWKDSQPPIYQWIWNFGAHAWYCVDVGRNFWKMQKYKFTWNCLNVLKMCISWRAEAYFSVFCRNFYILRKYGFFCIFVEKAILLLHFKTHCDSKDLAGLMESK